MVTVRVIYCNQQSQFPSDEKNQVKEEKVDMSTYIFGKDDEFQQDMARVGIEPGRFITFNLLALFIALGANFLGMTEGLLGVAPKPVLILAKDAGIDQIYAIKGFKRYVSTENKYEFSYPSSWLQDQTIALNKVRSQELPASIRKRQQATQKAGPDSAYGPAGGNGRINLSVIKNNVMPGFSLHTTLGNPREAAEKLLSTAIAPEGSGKVTKLLDAYEDTERNAYIFEYTVQKGENFFQHTISVITSRGGNELFTFTAVAPETKWDQYKEILSKSADSFKLL